MALILPIKVLILKILLFIKLENLKQKFEQDFNLQNNHKTLKWNPIYSNVTLDYYYNVIFYII